MRSEFPADATGTGNGRAQCCPYPPRVTASLGLVGEDQSRHAHRLISLTPETNAGSSEAAPFPLLILSDQPVDSSSSPASAPLPCPLVKSQEMPRPPALCCALPFPPLAFSLRLQRLGRDQGRLHPSPAIHTHHHPMRKKKK